MQRSQYCASGIWGNYYYQYDYFVVFLVWMLYSWDSCSSAGRAGRLVIGRSLVQTPALGRAELHVEVSLSKILNPKLLLMCSWHPACQPPSVRALRWAGKGLCHGTIVCYPGFLTFLHTTSVMCIFKMQFSVSYWPKKALSRANTDNVTYTAGDNVTQPTFHFTHSICLKEHYVVLGETF